MRILILFILFLIGCASVPIENPLISITRGKQPSDKIDWDKALREIVEDRIKERLKDCPEGTPKDICEKKTRIIVEGEIWADVLESDWEIVDVYYKSKCIWVTIKRGKDVPIVGNIKVGEFDNIEDIFMVNGKLKVIYKTQSQVNSEEKLYYSGGGFLSGIILVVIIIIAL